MKLIESQTYKNIAKAFAGECMARVRYEFIEYGARMQGYKELAKHIDKVVYNEFQHARMLYTALQDAETKQITNIEISSGYPFKEKWDLVENLRLAAEDERAEAEEVYPKYIAVAKKEGFNDVAKLMQNIVQVENCHKMLFTDLYNQLKSGKLYKRAKAVKWKCSECGYEATSKEAWQECPLCMAKQGSVMLKLTPEEDMQGKAGNGQKG